MTAPPILNCFRRPNCVPAICMYKRGVIQTYCHLKGDKSCFSFMYCSEQFNRGGGAKIPVGEHCSPKFRGAIAPPKNCSPAPGYFPCSGGHVRGLKCTVAIVSTSLYYCAGRYLDKVKLFWCLCIYAYNKQVLSKLYRCRKRFLQSPLYYSISTGLCSQVCSRLILLSISILLLRLLCSKS